jgi:hypothetical protein
VNAPNSDPCNDQDACTVTDICSGGLCAGSGTLDCDDRDICTIDTCEAVTGCGNEPIPDCSDLDQDQKRDELDECTTLEWSMPPTVPPDQHPSRFGLSVKKIDRPDDQDIKAKGFFTPVDNGPALDPALNGIHFRIEDAGGVLYDVSIPGTAGSPSACGTKDGWKTGGKPGKRIWKYTNKSGALPPDCSPGSARGIQKVQIKDRRTSSKQALQFNLKARDLQLEQQPQRPITFLKIDLGLGAQPSPGEASAAAIAGQCSESVFVGNPVPRTSPAPFCRTKLSGTQLKSIGCKGL